ncbi:MAG: ABC transporter permease subunit [Rhizobiales bacterium]|nr:ABC transporter permease subunit [Hyphomicrobiales bacterium]
MSAFELLGFGEKGWGALLLQATAMTLAVTLTAFFFGGVFGAVVARGKLSDSMVARVAGDVYTTVLRGVPDLLVIYLLYFGGSQLLSSLYRLVTGETGFIGINAFLTGAMAVGVVSGAYQAEVFRGAYLAIPRGEIEAARSVGMSGWTLFHRIVLPQVLRFAIPGLGNVWQLALKESALISVTGLVELLRQSQVASGSTRQPFVFYSAAAVLYLVLTSVSTWTFNKAESTAMRGVRRA